MRRRRAYGHGANKSKAAASAASAPPPDRSTLLVAAGLALLVLLAYSSSFAAGFVLDNDYVILKDARLRAFTWENVKAIFTTEYWGAGGHSGLYRPLTTLSYAFNFALLGHGAQPVGYHAINLLLHWANALMVFVLTRRALADAGAAALAGAVFAVHPLATEAVTNIVGRADLMAALFVLAALLWHDRLSGGATARRLAILAAAAAGGLLSKESAIALPGLMLAWDIAFHGKASWRRRGPSYAAVALAFAGVLVLRRLASGGLEDPGQNVTDNPILLADSGTARFTAIKVFGYYLVRFFWPHRLSCDHSFNQIPVASWSDAHAWLALLACLAGLAVLVWAHRRRPPLFFFLAFFAIAFLPVSNLLFPIGTILAERLMYLPSVGLVGVVAVVLAALAHRIPDGNDARFRALAATTGLVIVVLGIRTFRRNQDWRDELSLWTSAAQASPNSYKVHVGRSLALLRSPQGQEHLGEVIEILERGRAIVESQGLPAKHRPLSLYHNLGVSYLNHAAAVGPRDPAAARGGYERARDVLTKTIEIEDTLVLSTPAERATHALLLATALIGLERPEEALERIERALSLRPDDPNAYEARARALVQQRRFEDAAVSVDTAIVLGVDTPPLWSLAKEIYDRLAPREPALVEEHGQTLLARGHPMVNAHLLAASRELARRLVAAGQEDRARRVRDLAVSRLEVAPAAFDDVLGGRGAAPAE